MLSGFRKHQRYILIALVVLVGGSMVFFGLSPSRQSRRSTQEEMVASMQPVVVFGERIPNKDVFDLGLRWLRLQSSPSKQLTISDVYTQGAVILPYLKEADREGVCVSDTEVQLSIQEALQRRMAIEYVFARRADFRKNDPVSEEEIIAYYEQKKDEEFRKQDGSEEYEPLETVRTVINDKLIENKIDQALEDFLDAQKSAAKINPRASFRTAAESEGLSVETQSDVLLTSLADAVPDMAAETRLPEFLASSLVGKASPVFTAATGKFVVRVTARTSGYSPNGVFLQGHGWTATGYGNDPATPRTYEEQIARQGFSNRDFFQTMKERLVLMSLTELASSDVSIPDQVLQQVFLRNEQQARSDYLTFHPNDFSEAFELTEGELIAHYNRYREMPSRAGAFGYLEPERVEVEIVLADFDALKEKASNELDESELREFYNNNKDKYATESGQTVTDETEYSPFEQVEEEIADSLAARKAQEKVDLIREAAGLADSLVDDGNALDMKALAEKYGFDYIKTPPFSTDEVNTIPSLKKIAGSTSFVEQVFSERHDPRFRKGTSEETADYTTVSEIMEADKSLFFFRVTDRRDPHSEDYALLSDSKKARVRFDLTRYRSMMVAAQEVKAYAAKLNEKALSALADSLKREIRVTSISDPSVAIKGLENAVRFQRIVRQTSPDQLTAPIVENDIAYCGLITDTGDETRSLQYLAIPLDSLDLTIQPTDEEVDDIYESESDSYAYLPFQEVKEEVKAAYITSEAKRLASEELRQAIDLLRNTDGPSMKEVADQLSLVYAAPGAFPPEAILEQKPLVSTSRFVAQVGALDDNGISGVLVGDTSGYVFRILHKTPDSIKLEYIASPFDSKTTDIVPSEEDLEIYYEKKRSTDFLYPVDVARENIRKDLLATFEGQDTSETIRSLFRQVTASVFRSMPKERPLEIQMKRNLSLHDETISIEPKVQLPFMLRGKAVSDAVVALNPGDTSQPIVADEVMPQVILVHKPKDQSTANEDKEVRIQYVTIRPVEMLGTDPDISNDEINEYYEGHKEDFSSGPSIKGEILFLSAAHFAPLVRVTEEELRLHYEANESRYPQGFDNAKDSIRALLSDKRAELLAVEALQRTRARAVVDGKGLKSFELPSVFEFAETEFFDEETLSFPVIGFSPDLSQTTFALKDGDITEVLTTSSPGAASKPGAVIFLRTASRTSYLQPLEKAEDEIREKLAILKGLEAAETKAEEIRKSATDSDDPESFAAAVEDSSISITQAVTPDFNTTSHFRRPMLNPYMQYQMRYISAVVRPLGSRQFEFATRAFSLKPGQIAGPVVESGDMENCYILRLRGVETPTEEDFEDQKDSVRRQVQQMVKAESSAYAAEDLRMRAQSKE